MREGSVLCSGPSSPGLFLNPGFSPGDLSCPSLPLPKHHVSLLFALSEGNQPSSHQLGSCDTVKVQLLFSLSCVRSFCNPMDCSPAVSPLSMGFSRQEYWLELPFPPPGCLRNTRIEPVSPALAGGFFTLSRQGSPVKALCSHTQARDLPYHPPRGPRTSETCFLWAAMHVHAYSRGWGSHKVSLRHRT